MCVDLSIKDIENALLTRTYIYQCIYGYLSHICVVGTVSVGIARLTSGFSPLLSVVAKSQGQLVSRCLASAIHNSSTLSIYFPCLSVTCEHICTIAIGQPISVSVAIPKPICVSYWPASSLPDCPRFGYK